MVVKINVTLNFINSRIGGDPKSGDFMASRCILIKAEEQNNFWGMNDQKGPDKINSDKDNGEN